MVENNGVDYRDDTPLSQSDIDDINKLVEKDEYSTAGKKIANWLKTKLYGKPTRGAMSLWASIIGDSTEKNYKIARDSATKVDNIGDRFDDQIAGSTNDDETIDFRHSDMLQSSFKTMRKRGDFWDEEIQGRGVNPRWFHKGNTSSEVAFKQAVQIAAENNVPLILTEDYTTGAFTINDSLLIIGNGHTLTTKNVNPTTVDNYITVKAGAGGEAPQVEIQDLNLLNTAKYNVGLFNNDAGVNLTNVSAKGFLQKDIYYQKTSVNGTGHLSHITCEESPIGLDLKTTDVKVDHFQGKNCLTHINGAGGNDFLTEIHGWNWISSDKDWVNGSCLIKFSGSCIVSNAFADSVETAFELSEITSQWVLISIQNSIYFLNKDVFPTNPPKLFSNLNEYKGKLNVNGMEVDANGWTGPDGKPEIVTGTFDKSRIIINGLTNNGFADSHHINQFYTTEQNFYRVAEHITANIATHRYFEHQGQGNVYFSGGFSKKIPAGEKIGKVAITSTIADNIDVYTISGNVVNNDGAVLSLGVDYDLGSHMITIYNNSNATYVGKFKLQMSFIASKY